MDILNARFVPARRPRSLAGRRVRPALAALLLILVALPAEVAAQQEGTVCGELRGSHYGPYDYRTQRDKLLIVEQYHFTPSVENLIHGESGSLGNELSYTLNTSPNHHRALVAMMRLAERTKTPVGFIFPASGTPVLVDAIALVKGAKHPALAKEFYEYVTTPAALKDAAVKFLRIPTRTDLPNDSLRLFQRPETVDARAVSTRHWSAHCRRTSGDEQVVIRDDRVIVQRQSIGLRVEPGGSPTQIRLDIQGVETGRIECIHVRFTDRAFEVVR